MEQRMENTIRSVLRSGRSTSHRTSDGSRYTRHQYDSARVDELLALLDVLHPGVVERARALSADELEGARNQLARLESEGMRYATEYEINQRIAYLRTLINRNANQA